MVHVTRKVVCHTRVVALFLVGWCRFETSTSATRVRFARAGMPLGECATYGESKYLGVSVHPEHGRLPHVLQESLQGGFDFVVTPLQDAKDGRWHPDDASIDCDTWRTHVVAACRPWRDEGMDSEENDCTCLQEEEQHLQKELGRCAYLGLQAALVCVPSSSAKIAHLARIVSEHLRRRSYMHVWICVDLASPKDPCGTDAWEKWHQVRSLCDAPTNLSCALRVGSMTPGKEVMERWMGEPINAFLLETNAFRTNHAGYPALQERHSHMVQLCFQHQVQAILTGDSEHPVAPEDYESSLQESIIHFHRSTQLYDSPQIHPLHNYMEYLAFLFNQDAESMETDAPELEYRDHLQIPLQPLMDHLQNGTYEVFEKDKVKYQQYYKAIAKCLDDRRDQFTQGRKAILAVVGAGRGPLVQACVMASKEAGVESLVYAVEKNPNAVLTLEHLIDTRGWGSIVTLVNADMRVWMPQRKVDVLVSELLGSFGDNELSPECLDGAQKCLSDDGVSIPFSYTSYLEPIAAGKIYKKVQAYDSLKNYETPYVVKLHSIYRIAPAQATFTFQHPSPSKEQGNRRAAEHVFWPQHPKVPTLCHGLAGYFTAVLYKDVLLSTHPDSHTDGMHSWFPIFFPFVRPVRIAEEEPLLVRMWRAVSPSKVWYEWAVQSPEVLPIHNPGGRSYWVGLASEG